MSSLELNKAVGSVLLVALTLMVIGIIGNALVSPSTHTPAEVKVAAADSADKPEAKSAAIAPIAPLLANASAEKGAAVFKKCAACHSVEKDGKHKIGPNLWNVVNASHGGKSDYSYSNAMKEKPGDWNYENLNAFLLKPKAYLPGTKMAFGGLSKDTDRANLIAYLRTLSDSPAPLP